MKFKALKPTEKITISQIRPFMKKKAKLPKTKNFPYLFFASKSLNLFSENIN